LQERLLKLLLEAEDGAPPSIQRPRER